MDTARKDRMGSEGEADQTHLSSQCAGHPPRPISGAHAPPPRSSPCPVLDTPATRTYSRPRAFHSDGIGYHDGDHHTATASPDARSDDQAGPSSDGPETSLPCCRRSAAAAASPRGPYFSRERWFPLITACLERDAEANTDRFSDFWPGADPSPPAASPPQATASAPDDAATLHARDARLFHGRNVPSIDVADYLDRLFSFFQCSPAALFAALWYIRRVALSDPYLQVTRHTVHRCVFVPCAAAPGEPPSLHGTS